MVFPIKTLTWTLVLAGIFVVLAVSIHCYDTYVMKKGKDGGKQCETKTKK